MTRCTLWIALFLLAFGTTLSVHAQAADGMLSEGEVESLRDASYFPILRIEAYEKILNTRQKQINDIVSHPRHAGRELDLHDLMDQFASITDELNDNLDSFRSKHRDVRKSLPKLVQDADRWSKTLQAPADDKEYDIVRKLALDNLKDLREITDSLGPDLNAYFKAHPDAEKAERDRMDTYRGHDARQ